MTIESEIARLNTTNTALTQEVVGIKNRIDAQEQNVNDDAQSALEHKNAAQTAETGAGTHEANAKVEADRAKNEADNASAVVTGGTATLDSEAGKIPLADSDGVIDADWLPAEITGRNVFAEDQAKGNSKYAASGFVHMGKSYVGTGSTDINQGLHTRETTPNELRLGRLSGSGASKSDMSVINIAGIETEISSLNDSILLTSKIKFPEAPNGTVTYDSDTGAIVDYTKDVDPKYGDVAPDVNEAVARAFEGVVKNGDFRFGDDGSWSGIGTAQILDGKFSANGSVYSSAQQKIYYHDEVRTFRVSVTVTAVPTAGNNQVQFNGISLFGELEEKGLGTHEVEVTLSPEDTGDGALKLIAATLDGGQLEISNISATEVTTEVVTERVDMWGFEGYLEEVSSANPYVYQNGLIQSQAIDIDGVATSSSNRPDTYYAVFDGDTTSRGKGVNFWAISDAQRKDIFSNPDNKLYLIDGKIYQWRLRQRTIAGAGNGDWLNSHDSTVSGSVWERILSFAPSVAMRGQGFSDTVEVFNTSGSYISTGGDGAAAYTTPITGGFTSRHENGAFGHCYFLVCGTVSRLNQGAYHPSFNAMGASNCYYLTGSTGSWHDTDNPLLSERDCFDYADGWNAGTGKVPAVGNRGGINSGISGRPDSRFFDAIYADGLGGVVLDTRYSAWDKSAPEHKAKALAMVENGTYRGVEKLVETKLGTQYTPDHSNTNGLIMGMPHDTLKIGCILFVENPSGTYEATTVISTYPSNSYGLTNGSGCNVSPNVGRKAGGIVVYMQPKNHSVGGEFQLTEVIGDPANILANPDLKDGWLGVWNSTIPASSTLIPLSRKALDASADVTYTSDNGIAWGTTNVTLDGVNNTGSTWSAPSSAVYSYTAFAKQTKPSTNQSVFNGEAGVGSVFASKHHSPSNGGVLAEALTGTVLTSSGPHSRNHFCTRTINIADDLALHTDVNLSTAHVELTVTGSLDVNAFKTLTTQLSVNDQASIQFQYEELVYTEQSASEATQLDGSVSESVVTGDRYAYGNDIWESTVTASVIMDSLLRVGNTLVYKNSGNTVMKLSSRTGDWGDDGKMFITTTGDSTNTDTNGNTVKCGVHELAVPYGWCKVEV